ncbi:MAG: hypothetical protein FJX36_03060 [Alphaproteobacteria bacterium]|nr:hypothetical protein [Alphaproteobacteria bacterium]
MHPLLALKAFRQANRLAPGRAARGLPRQAPWRQAQRTAGIVVARSRSEPFSRVLSRIVLLVVLVAIVGGAAFLVTWDIPPPTATVEIVLPDDHFPK